MSSMASAHIEFVYNETESIRCSFLPLYLETADAGLNSPWPSPMPVTTMLLPHHYANDVDLLFFHDCSNLIEISVIYLPLVTVAKVSK
mmetsp:Transcript_10933/g.22885  ORF Transcript_10933/g.22885 Transcript_10933/m.22885 type:complete len:88 (+) Transcript_10933:50-313(+)